MCPHTTIHVFAYYYMRPHTTMYTVFASAAAVLGVVAGYIYKYTCIITIIFIHNIYTHIHNIYIYVLYIIYIYLCIHIDIWSDVAAISPLSYKCRGPSATVV